MNSNNKSLSNIINKNFQYDIDYDYDRNRDNCECDYICRCSKIENARIDSIDLIKITKIFNEVFNEDEFTECLINRILTACKLYDEDYWDLKIGSGYYGEEIDGIYINNPEVSEWLSKLKYAKTNEEKLFIALECEYGYILDELKNKEWKFEKIDKNKLIIGQREHYKKLDKKIVENYKNYPYASGVCIIKDEGFKLIDGYHRVTANCSNEIKMIVGK